MEDISLLCRSSRRTPIGGRNKSPRRHNPQFGLLNVRTITHIFNQFCVSAPHIVFIASAFISKDVLKRGDIL